METWMQTRRAWLLANALVAATASLIFAQEVPLKIGVLSDLSGPYADSAGAGSVFAAQMAVQDFGGVIKGQDCWPGQRRWRIGKYHQAIEGVRCRG